MQWCSHWLYEWRWFHMYAACTDGAHLVVLGGPAMLIGLGGGAASSMATGGNSAELDFASVQRGNAEIERRCVQPLAVSADLMAQRPCSTRPDIKVSLELTTQLWRFANHVTLAMQMSGGSGRVQCHGHGYANRIHP